MQLRWLERETGKTLMDQYGYYYPETKCILQYRVEYTKTNYDAIDTDTGEFSKSLNWSEWQDVPITYVPSTKEKV